jgi:hypothetical protein
MEKLQDEFFGFLLNRIKEQLTKRLRWLVFILPLYGLYWIASSTPDGPSRILATCNSTEAAVLEYKAWLAAFLFLFVVSFIIARYSNSKFRIERERVFPKCHTYESSDHHLIQTKIVESNEEEGRNRYIRIENNLPHNIDYIKGYVIFGQNLTTTFTVPFEVNIPIPPHGGYQVMNAIVTNDQRSWSTFSTFIEVMSAGGQTQKRLNLYGGHFRRMTLHFALTRYNYLCWMPFIRSYELSWVLQIWRFKIYPWLRYFPTKPRVYEFYQPTLTHEIAFSALPEFSALAVRRQRGVNLESLTAIACEALSLLYCVTGCLLKAMWQSRVRVGERLAVCLRRKFNQLIWLAVVGTAGGLIVLSYANFALFLWRLALLWGGVAKYGILAALNLQ